MEPDRRRDVAGEDRLSLLPDDIICYILSFLPTENAVAASVLSKRFRYLFAFVPTIHLSLFTFQKHYRRLAMINGESMNDKEAEAVCKFTSVVERMLTMQSSHIYKFHIDVLRPGEVDGSLVCSWISEALRRNNIQKLEIYFGKRMNNIFLPSEIFQGRKLVSLKLLTEFELKFPELVDLPNLRLLHLGLLRFVGDEYFIGKAFAGCPVLEELDLCFTKSTGFRALNIQIPSLKKLSLCFCYGINKLFIDTPNLLYFIYQDSVHTEISVKPLNSLVKACIRIMNILPPSRREKLIFSSLINGVVKTKSLNFQAQFLLDYSLPKFHMLTRVEVVDIHIDSNYGVLLEVIKDSMPALEFLVLKMYTGKLHEFHTLQTKPTFFFQHLTEVEIRNFHAHESVYKLVEYILLCGAALKRMTISPISETTSVCNELLSLERTSKTCQIVFNH